MRYILIWELLTFNAETHEVTWRSGSERHTCAEMCRGAEQELYALTKIRGACVPQRDFRRWHNENRQGRPGTWEGGRYISKYTGKGIGE